MCGRYAIITPPDELKAFLGYDETPNFPMRFNIAPTQPVPVVHLVDGIRHFTLMRWGFIPGWVKDLKTFPLIINIRSETMREKASFRAAFTRRRALMPADGFYEWQRLDKTSRPFLIRRPDRKPFAFAALWETWCTSDGSELDTVALINTTANGLISAIHERSPVILPETAFDAWLDPATPPDKAFALLRPPPEDMLELVAVSTRINKVAHDDADVQASPVDEGHSVSKNVAEKSRPKPIDEDQGSLF